MNRFGARVAFMAAATSLLIWSAGTAAANSSHPIYACFSPQNAALIGQLGADDPSVRAGFESGECLALPAGVPLNDVERSGNLWRFRILGAQPYLFAADWAAGFQTASQVAPSGFEQYLPVTERLMASAHGFADCYDASKKLEARMEDHERRWKDYQSWGGSKPNNSAPVVVIYVGDIGRRLAAEGVDLRDQSVALDRRCRQYTAIEADDDFVTFVRTARQA